MQMENLEWGCVNAVERCGLGFVEVLEHPFCMDHPANQEDLSVCFEKRLET